MASEPFIDALAPIRVIMERHGANCSPEEFHAAVNITFHNFESEVYDQEHREMWESLPREFERLANDCAGVAKLHTELHLLDIGCGTGLATDCLLKSNLGPKINSIDLLDTSRAMLNQATKRARYWDRPLDVHEGLIDALPKGKRYSLIVTSSVLHHVPDLGVFLRALRTLQADSGIYIHLQDPNGDYSTDPEYLSRVEKLQKSKRYTDFIRRFSPEKILNRIYRELAGKADDSYCAKTNRKLLDAGLIASPLSISEIYSITDIHVQDGTGISIPTMKKWMPDYELISARSYAFFGALWSSLPADLKKIEEELTEKNMMNGMHIGAAWKLQ